MDLFGDLGYGLGLLNISKIEGSTNHNRLFDIGVGLMFHI